MSDGLLAAGDASFAQAKRVIITTPSSELACERDVGGTMRCLRGGPIIRLRNGSSLLHGARPRGVPVKLPQRTTGPSKSATPDPPFNVVKFISVLPRSNRARIERQLEIMTALKRTCEFPGVWQVHLLVKSVPEAMGMLQTYQATLPPRVAAMYELGRMPLNSDFVEYAYTQLKGEWVLACNDDIYLEGTAWLKPPPDAMLLSRHAKANETCNGCMQKSCDARKSQDFRSLCNRANFGSFDAWVHKFDEDPRTDEAAMAMLRTPRHAFGADNLLLYVFETHLKVKLHNRCLSYRLNHLHCHLPTSIGNCADTAKTRGYGDGTFITHGHMNKLLRKWDTHITEKEGAGIVRRRLPVEY
tara:strand:- start:602 stop:1672 length:1071 start_codon:yes stop_codon:yes gene_type:complete